MNNPLAYTDPSGYCTAVTGTKFCAETTSKSSGKSVDVGSSGSGSSLQQGQSQGNGAVNAQIKIVGEAGEVMDIGSELEKSGARLARGQTNEDGTAEAIYQFGGNGTYDPDINVELWKTIGNSTKQAVGNLVPDIVNGIAGWTERFLHKDEGSLGRISDWVDSRNVVADDIVPDIRIASTSVIAFLPLGMGARGSGPIAGVFTLNRNSKSNKAIANFGKNNSVEFIYDLGTNTFALGASGTFKHRQLASAINAQGPVLGGMFRNNRGSTSTNEFSGTFHQNWNPSRRAKFVNDMKRMGINITHEKGF
jgi:hypothetical protein